MQCQNGDRPRAVTGDIVATDTDQGFVTFDKAFKNLMQLDTTSLRSIRRSWRSIVENYSVLEQGNIELDRIVALSGVAAEYGEAIKALQIQSPLGPWDDIYVAGLWVSDVYGLLWEQAGESPVAIVRGLPTWSWASLRVQNLSQDDAKGPRGAPVRWSVASLVSNTSVFAALDEFIGRKRAYKPSMVCRLEDVIRIQVEQATWEPDFMHTTGQSNNRYGNDARFAALKLNGRKLPVWLQSHLDKDETEMAAEVTGHSPVFGRANWRRVSTLTQPDNIAGWASVDHPEHLDDHLESNIVALFVMNTVGRHRMLGLGNLMRRHNVFLVLFLRPINRPEFIPCYERIGVGRLFELELDELFQKSKDESIWLI